MRTLVAGYYGFGNLGDELILSVLIKQLKATYPDGRITVLSEAPEETRKLHHIEAISRWNPFSIFWELGNSDLFVLGGGGLLQDKTSFRSLFYYVSLLIAARVLMKQIFLYAIGVETLQHPASGRLLRWALSGSRVRITVRDKESVQKLIDIGISEKNIRMMQDPVFQLALSVAPKERYGQALGRILFIPRFPAPPTGLALYNEVRLLFETRLGARMDEVVFEPRVEKKVRPAAVSINNIDQLTELLAASDVVVSARYHGLVLAALAGRPFIGIGDAQKTGRLCAAFQMPFLGWEASRKDLEAALGLLGSSARRRDVLDSARGLIDQLF